MNNIETWVKALLALSCVVLMIALFQRNSAIRHLNEENVRILRERDSYERYVRTSILYPESSEEIDIIRSIPVSEDRPITIIVPAGVCDACFLELINLLIEDDIQPNQVSMFFYEDNRRIISEAKVRGFDNIHVLDGALVSGEILIVITNKTDEPRRYIHYQDGDALILAELLSLLNSGSSH